jgi:tetratricopeptide (TPR) repeat protein
MSSANVRDDFASLLAAILLLVISSPLAYGGSPPTPEFTHAISARKRSFGLGRPIATVMAEVNQSIKKNPSWEGFFRRAVLRYQSNQFAAAAQDCEQSLKLQKSQAVYYLLAASNLFQGPTAWSNGLLATKCMAKANPESIHSHEIGAFIAALNGDFDGSINHLAAYETQLVLMGKSRYELPARGLIDRLSNDDLEKITAGLGKSDQQKIHKQLVLALAAFFRNDYAGSAATFSGISRLASHAAEGLKQSRMNAADLALAISLCNAQMLASPSGLEAKALQLVHQTNAAKSALSLLDATYFVLNERDKSLTFINHLIEKESALAANSKSNAKLISLLYFRASLNEQMRDIKSALQDWQQILKLDQNQPQARLDVCRLEMILNENKEVLQELDKYITAHPSDGSAHFLRAQIFVVDGNWQPAVHDLTFAINDGYYLLKAMQARAACYRAMHQNSLAAKDIELVKLFKVDDAAIIVEANPPSHQSP